MISYTKFCRYLYTLGFYLAIPAVLWRLKSKERWLERFGFLAKPVPAQEKVIWVHAVSLGETIAVTPLIKSLLASYPDYKIVLTSTTLTGSAQARKQFGDAIYNFYLPYDLPGSLRRFFKQIHPHLGIIMETELWPNLLATCEQMQLPLLLANARLSAKSANGYKKIKAITKDMLNTFTCIAAQSASDAERFIDLGARKEIVEITGNMKFDIQVPADLAERGRLLRQPWGDRPVWIAASTHEGEENLILEALAKIKNVIPKVLLVLVPRHPERFSKVGELCQQNGFSIALRSRKEPVTPETDILLGDTMGELMLFYAASDVAFVGGSWVDVGGHNLIEPACLHVPVLTGPQLYNFVDVSRLLLNAGGAKIVENPQTAADTIIQLFNHPEQRMTMGDHAFKAVMANTGALEKHLNWVKNQIGR